MYHADPLQNEYREERLTVKSLIFSHILYMVHVSIFITMHINGGGGLLSIKTSLN